jgi:hypothetical protein
MNTACFSNENFENDCKDPERYTIPVDGKIFYRR